MFREPSFLTDDSVVCSQLGQVTSSFDFKVLNDPIHGHIQMPKSVMALVDTPEFQRLRNLKQLGGLYFVFPGACNNRFEHCIGTAYLAGKLINRLRQEQPELAISERRAFLVQVAALTHDLGHGPFSHLFDNYVIPKVMPGQRWSHEKGSEMMLQKLIDDNGDKEEINFTPREVRFLKDLIAGTVPANEERRFLYQIVSNSSFGVDVDKFDYLARDCYYLGVKHSYDSARLLNFSKVINGDLCFHAKEAYNCNELFHTRYTLHKQIFSHRVGQSVEYMIGDALIAADEELGITASITDPDRYLHLNDCVLNRIETSSSPALKTSQDILKRLWKRDLYKFVEEILLDGPTSLALPYKSVSAEDIIAAYTPLSKQDELQPDDLIVQDLRINYGMRNHNPVDRINFYRSWNDTESFRLPAHKVSLLIPELFEERTIRLFCRHRAKTRAALAAFQQFIGQRSFASPGAKRKRPRPDGDHDDPGWRSVRSPATKALDFSPDAAAGLP